MHLWSVGGSTSIEPDTGRTCKLPSEEKFQIQAKNHPILTKAFVEIWDRQLRLKWKERFITKKTNAPNTLNRDILSICILANVLCGLLDLFNVINRNVIFNFLSFLQCSFNCMRHLPPTLRDVLGQQQFLSGVCVKEAFTSVPGFPGFPSRTLDCQYF